MDDPLDRLIEAVQAKDSAAANGWAAAVKANEHDGFRLTQVAVECKEAGHRDTAEQLLLSTTVAHPECAAAWYELGVIYRDFGRHNLAIEALIEACTLAPGDFRFALLLIHMLHAVGAHPDALVQAERAARLPEADGRRLDILREFGSYMGEFPPGRGRYILDQVRRHYSWVDPLRVADEINAAIDEGRGFSLVRLGDGEGAFARINAEDEARYANLYGWMRREWADLLFGPAFDPRETGYSSLVETLMPVCATADIAGVPYPSWLEHEYRGANQRGVPCLLNTHRWFLEHRHMAVKPLLCDQNIHIELNARGLLEPIIRRSRRISLISSNVGLAEMLEARFDLEAVEVLKIPAEKYSSDLRDAKALAGEHFPTVFWDVMGQISRPQYGRVFLIAAGTLAKFYAAAVKQHGGVALDIGSLVDGWMKIRSRPGYGDELALVP